ncbi:MAG: hypothetical protein ACR2NP_01100, partial [Pirellulaceae bacterium]
MFAELKMIQDPRIEDKVLARYRQQITVLTEEGFQRLGMFETKHGLSLAPMALFFGALGNEIWRYAAPLHINWYHSLLQSADGDAVVYPMGLGVKFYSFFDDGSTLMTSNCEGKTGSMPKQQINKRYLPKKSIGDTWLYHLAGCEQQFAAGREALRGDLVEHFLDVQIREDDPWALFIGAAGGWLVPPLL